MDSVIVFGLLAIQFVGLALLVIALPLFVGLMAWDVVSDLRHPEVAAVEQIEARRAAPVRSTPRLSA
jgi:hypothetical protein